MDATFSSVTETIYKSTKMDWIKLQIYFLPRSFGLHKQTRQIIPRWKDILELFQIGKIFFNKTHSNSDDVITKTAKITLFS